VLQILKFAALPIAEWLLRKSSLRKQGPIPRALSIGCGVGPGSTAGTTQN